MANENVLLDALKDKLYEVFESTSFPSASSQPSLMAFARPPDENECCDQQPSAHGDVLISRKKSPDKPEQLSLSNLRAMFGSSKSAGTEQSPPSKKPRQSTIKSFARLETKLSDRRVDSNAAYPIELLDDQEQKALDNVIDGLFNQETISEIKVELHQKSEVTLEQSNEEETDFKNGHRERQRTKSEMESGASHLVKNSYESCENDARIQPSKKDRVTECDSDTEVVIRQDDMPARTAKNVRFEVSFSIDRLGVGPSQSVTDREDEKSRRFYAQIDPDSNDTAEAELAKQIGKSDFERMTIFGQFNLGFIIAGLASGREDDTRRVEDLFIIDQHATDEKYNFERLEKSSSSNIQSQRLAVPQSLDLPPTSRDLLASNIETFTRNGFGFDPDLRLTEIPTCRNWTFGKAEIEELLFMLGEDDCANPRDIRPSRIRSMFASRACRTSVMIGTALDTRAMTPLVRHMAQMDQPWSCPHGRPTMRHLINLNMIRR